MIKALILDLDGTLLTSAKRISAKTCAVLRQCRDSGIRVFVATARPPLLRQMLRLTPEEEDVIQDGGVYYNGGCVCCGDTREYATMPADAAGRAVTIVSSHTEANLAVQMSGERHGFRYGLADDQYALWGVDRADLIAFETLGYNDVVKIVVFSPWSLLPDLHARLAATMVASANVYLTGRSDFRAIEIVDKGINKKLAVERVARMCGLTPDEVAVFGDDHNDVEMLAGFRHSVAMGNACNEAKAAARHIAPSNDEDGIFHAVTSILQLV